MILRMGGPPQFSWTVPGFVPVRPALLVGFCLLSGCLWLPSAVWRALSDIWYWCLGKVYPGVFFLFDESHFSPASEWSLIFSMRVGKEVRFFLKHITLLSQEEDIHTQCGEATECPQEGLPWRGECSKSTQNLWRYIWMFTHVIFRFIKVVVEKWKKKCR